jgi:hypothetical protein
VAPYSLALSCRDLMLLHTEIYSLRRTFVTPPFLTYDPVHVIIFVCLRTISECALDMSSHLSISVHFLNGPWTYYHTYVSLYYSVLFFDDYIWRNAFGLRLTANAMLSLPVLVLRALGSILGQESGKLEYVLRMFSSVTSKTRRDSGFT